MNMYLIFNTSWPVAFRLCVSLATFVSLSLCLSRNYRSHNKKDIRISTMEIIYGFAGCRGNFSKLCVIIVCAFVCTVNVTNIMYYLNDHLALLLLMLTSRESTGCRWGGNESLLILISIVENFTLLLAA